MNARLAVTVTSPDGKAALARGLGAWLSKAAPARRAATSPSRS